MWKKLKDSNLYIFYSKDYKIYVTDYVSVWYTYFSKASFLRCLKDSNSLLEMSEEALLEKGHLVLSNPGKLKNLDIQFEEKILILNATMLFGYPFKLQLKLLEGSKALFFQKVTQPFLKTILELKNSQLELCQLLKKKDSEIEEYKCEGGEIAIKHLKTKPFDEHGVLSKYMSFQEQFGSTNDMLCGLIEMVLDTPEDTQRVEIENLEQPKNMGSLKIKMEPPSQTVSSTSVSVKVKPSSETVMPVKTEPSSQSVSVKVEPNSQISDSQSLSYVSANLNIKQESQSPIKRESESIRSMVRRKMKKLF